MNGILNDVNQAEKRIVKLKKKFFLYYFLKLEKENELNQIILVDEHIVKAFYFLKILLFFSLKRRMKIFTSQH